VSARDAGAATLRRAEATGCRRNSWGSLPAPDHSRPGPAMRQGLDGQGIVVQGGAPGHSKAAKTPCGLAHRARAAIRPSLSMELAGQMRNPSGRALEQRAISDLVEAIVSHA
jgi:hypothetical protein